MLSLSPARRRVLRSGGGRPSWLPAIYSDGLRFDGVQQAWIQGRRFNSMSAMLVSGLVGFTRASPEIGVRASGALQLFANNVPAITNLGLGYWPARTNKCTNYNVSPTDLTNVTKSGDAAAVLSVVDDTAALAAQGLLIGNGKVYKLDNSTGIAVANASVSGVTGNTGAHTISVYARGGSGILYLSAGATGSSPISISSTYVRIVANPTNTQTLSGLVVRASAGQIIYFFANQLEEGAFATSLIPVAGAAATRAAPVMPIKVSPGVYNVTIILQDGTSAVVPNVTVDATGYIPPTQAKQVARIYFEVSNAPPISLYTPAAEWEPVRTDLMTLVGTSVSAWNDLVSAVSQAQASSNQRPAFNGVGMSSGPAVVFDGIDDCLRTASQPFGAAASPQEFVLVIDQQSLVADTGTKMIWTVGGTTSATRIALKRVVDGGVNRLALGVGDGSTEQVLTGSRIDASGLLLAHIIVTATTAELRIGKSGTVTSEGTMNVVPAVGSSYVTMGASNAASPTGYFKGLIAPVGAWVTTLLTEPQRAALNAALMQKWSI